MKKKSVTLPETPSEDPPPLASPDPRRRFHFALLASILAISNLYFFTGGGWNQACHFDLVRALVERGTVRIDAYRENTGDESSPN